MELLSSTVRICVTAVHPSIKSLSKEVKVYDVPKRTHLTFKNSLYCISSLEYFAVRLLAYLWFPGRRSNGRQSLLFWRSLFLLALNRTIKCALKQLFMWFGD